MAPKAESYEVYEPARAILTDPQTGEQVELSFTKGKHAPRNEGEEAALEMLFSIGKAARPDGTSIVLVQPELVEEPAPEPTPTEESE